MESSKPGAYKRWGITDDEVLKANPKIVICHVSGYGQDGHPDYLGRASYDFIGQGFGGMMHLTGFADPEPPVRAVPLDRRLHNPPVSVSGRLWRDTSTPSARARGRSSTSRSTRPYTRFSPEPWSPTMRRA